MGLIVPRFQSTAVARNRVRRRLEEIWRREIRHTQGERDLLIRARKDAYGARFSELRAELLRWVEGL
jgi:ribonuclease P protein component